MPFYLDRRTRLSTRMRFWFNPSGSTRWLSSLQQENLIVHQHQKGREWRRIFFRGKKMKMCVTQKKLSAPQNKLFGVIMKRLSSSHCSQWTKKCTKFLSLIHSTHWTALGTYGNVWRVLLAVTCNRELSLSPPILYERSPWNIRHDKVS